MQEFNDRNILSEFDDVIAISRKINSLLVNKDKGDLSEKVKALYDKRKHLLEKIKIFADSKNGLKFIQLNADNWDKRVSDSIDIEKKNLELLRQITSETGKQLKELNKNRSVLVYSKADKS